MHVRRTTTGLAAALTTVLALACAAPALAAAPDAAHTSAAHVSATKVSAAAQDAALRFWTPQRLRAARDVTSLAVPDGAAPPRTAPAATAGQRPVLVPPALGPAAATSRTANATSAAPAVSSPGAWNGGGLIATTAGKVFFQNASGGTFACSATVANSNNKSVVLTAGHCVVNAGTGEVYRNWVFIPGYGNGNRPFGTFTAQTLFHDGQYVSTGGNANYDFAFARVAPLNGRTLVDTVGAEGIAFNSPTGQFVYSFGYGGSAAEGGGERLNYCTGTEFPDAGRAGSTMWGIDCVQTGGSSGGGFLSNFNASGGGGYLVGNISVSAGSNEYHPYLGNEALSLYQQAGA
ncbi:trypsin-like serine peptidase [Actinacidiphila alni]|uniref:trypsin-like serine peptidase n=1 Tax=Actinacidiphila alni TaxID=380248 RepID=UPI003451AFD0